MDKELFNVIESTCLQIDKATTVRFGYFNDIQTSPVAPNAYPLVVVTPFTSNLSEMVTGQARVVASTRVIVLYPSQAMGPSDRRSGAAMPNRQDTYDKAARFVEKLYTRLSSAFADIGIRLMEATSDPLQDIGTPSLTGKGLLLKISYITDCNGDA